VQASRNRDFHYCLQPVRRIRWQHLLHPNHTDTFVTIALYHCRLDRARSNSERLAATLPREERNRAQRFHRERDRLRYCVGRLLLRTILTQRTGVPARDIPIEKSALGKPYLVGGPAFNISHSGDAVLLGVADSGNIGVDVELIRQLDDLDSMAQRCFSARELNAFEGTSELERRNAFFQTWARKEAFVKAVGDGLHINLKHFSVSSEDTAENLLIDASACCLDTANWDIRSVSLPGPYAAAVALDCRDFAVEVFDYGSWLSIM
jgi:4'-phosphopantetheinyl transferase